MDEWSLTQEAQWKVSSREHYLVRQQQWSVFWLAICAVVVFLARGVIVPFILAKWPPA